MIFDSHCHIDTEKFDRDRAAVIDRAHESGVRRMIVIGAGSGVDACRRGVGLAKEVDQMWASVGIHPHNAGTAEPWMMEVIEELCAEPEVVAIGETGLDYYYTYSTPQEQQKSFREFIRLALKVDLPLILHVRDAHEDARRILDEEGAAKVGGVVHCFTGTPDDAEKYVEMGFHLGIPGIVTFRRPGSLPKVVEDTPLDRILVETDSPFLAPTPYRGKRNEPAYVVHVVEKIAEIRELPVDEVARITTENTNRLFGLPAA